MRASFRLLAVGVAAATALALAACSPPGGVSSRAGGGAAEVLTVAIDAEPPTFDWQQSTAGATQVGAIQVLETLYALDEDYRPVPQLAAAEPEVTPDGLGYTIPLRQDVLFHDGTAMTAEDVVASLERWGEVSSNGAPFFAHVAALEATAEYEVTLTLNSPYDVEAALAVPIAAAAIMPAEIVQDYGKDMIDEVTDVVGTGPYRFTDWRKGRAYELERNDDYHPADNGATGGLAAAHAGSYRTVVVNLVAEASTRFQSTAAGQYDVGLSIPGDLYGQFTGQQRIDPQTISPYYSQYLLFDTSEPPFDDPDVRRAAALALDQASLAEATYGSDELFTLNGAIYPDGMGVLSSDAGITGYDERNLDEAKALLEKSSYDGRPLRFMTSQGLSQVYNFSVSAAQQLEAAGFAVDLDVAEWAAMNGRYTEPDTWDMFSTAFGIGYTIPSSHLLLNGEFPFEGWYAQDDEMAALIEQWHAAASAQERASVMDRIQEQFYVDQPAVKLADYAMLNAVSKGVSLDEVTFYQPTWWSAEPR